MAISACLPTALPQRPLAWSKRALTSLQDALEPGSTWPPEVVANAVRALVFGLCMVLAAQVAHPLHQLGRFPLVFLGGALAASYQNRNVAGELLRVVEAAVCAFAVLATGGAGSALFPYLIASAFAGGILAGVGGSLISPACAVIVLVGASPLVGTGIGFNAQLTQWVLLAVAAGLLAAWVRRLQASSRPGAPSDKSYAEAYRLLVQLRPVARQLSLGLDPGTIAEGLLESLRELHHFDRGAVYVRRDADRIVPLAYLGAPRPDWDVDVRGDGLLAHAWLSGQPRQLPTQLSGAPGSAVVIPLLMGARTFGLVAYESAQRRLGPRDADAAAQLVELAAPRLDTALLFNEVRDVATAEERRRVAREIHDGIAQELSSLGYVMDGLVAEARDRRDDTDGPLVDLRGEVTRLIRELRMSIFDLRSEVDVHGGLGAALSEYVRSVGRQSGLTVHMSLAEATNRLPAETEAELLRIAQEAVTNVRKHADAENLWVSLVVEPPGAVLRIEDDGRGLGRSRHDSFGLHIMRERAARLRTNLTIEPRAPRGTRVEVRIGSLSSAPVVSETDRRTVIGERVLA